MEIELGYLRKEKSEEMLAEYERGIKRNDSLKVEIYDNAVILPRKVLNGQADSVIPGGVL